jgi:hypothetical protein
MAAIVVYECDNPQLKALTMLIASWATNNAGILCDAIGANNDGFAYWCRTGASDANMLLGIRSFNIPRPRPRLRAATI